MHSTWFETCCVHVLSFGVPVTSSVLFKEKEIKNRCLSTKQQLRLLLHKTHQMLHCQIMTSRCKLTIYLCTICACIAINYFVNYNITVVFLSMSYTAHPHSIYLWIIAIGSKTIQTNPLLLLLFSFATDHFFDEFLWWRTIAQIGSLPSLFNKTLI